MWETWVQSQGWEVLLEEGMATHSSILSGESPWTEEHGGLQSIGMQRVGHNWATNTSLRENKHTEVETKSKNKLGEVEW